MKFKLNIKEKKQYVIILLIYLISAQIYWKKKKFLRLKYD
jgi:hypothetical protein